MRVLGDIAGGSVAAAVPATDTAARGPEMSLEGDMWRLSFEGTTVREKRAKGLDDLATLLAAPGTEISCLDLMGSAAAGTGTEDELLDGAARRAYEERVRELQSDIDEAESDHDIGRAERLRVELDAIVDQLTAALGLGGRARRTTGDAERARSAVTQRLRSAMKRIEGHHPTRGAHLRASVETGTFCRYAPAEPAPHWTIVRSP